MLPYAMNAPILFPGEIKPSLFFIFGMFLKKSKAGICSFIKSFIVQRLLPTVIKFLFLKLQVSKLLYLSNDFSLLYVATCSHPQAVTFWLSATWLLSVSSNKSWKKKYFFVSCKEKYRQNKPKDCAETYYNYIICTCHFRHQHNYIKFSRKPHKFTVFLIKKYTQQKLFWLKNLFFLAVIESCTSKPLFNIPPNENTTCNKYCVSVRLYLSVKCQRAAMVFSLMFTLPDSLRFGDEKQKSDLINSHKLPPPEQDGNRWWWKTWYHISTFSWELGDISSCPNMPGWSLIGGFLPSVGSFCLTSEAAQWVWLSFGGYSESTSFKPSAWRLWSGPFNSGKFFFLGS